MNAQGSSVGVFRRAWRWVRWPLAVLILFILGVAIYRIPTVQEKQRSQEAVAVIQAQHLTMADVDGSNLPPPPDSTQVNATVAGIDANGNGIRDDVELAIFEKYPGPSNLKIRAAELQYAMALQTMLIKVSSPNIWKAAAIQEDRGYQCIGQTYPRDDLRLFNKVTGDRTNEVKNFEINTGERKVAEAKAFDFTTTYSLPNEDVCDIGHNL